MTSEIVTIVIPSYGQAHFLHDAIRTALAQTHQAIEVIVVDDAAPDGWRAEAIAREFGVAFVRNERNLGTGGARNAGIAAGSGAYVLPLDADDMLAPDYVAKAVRVLNARPDAGVCYAKVRAFGTTSRTWDNPAGWSQRQLIQANRLPNSSLFRRSCWEEVGGYAADPALPEDWDLWIRVALRGWQFQRIPEYLMFYRQHGANKTVEHAPGWESFARRMLAAHPGAPAGVIAFDFDEPHGQAP